MFLVLDILSVCPMDRDWIQLSPFLRGLSPIGVPCVGCCSVLCRGTLCPWGDLPGGSYLCSLHNPNIDGKNLQRKAGAQITLCTNY